MSLYEVIRFALRGLSANKLRSALTMLGILIGVAAVILLVAVGNGSAQAISDRIEALGTNTITVMSTVARHHADIEAVYTYEGTEHSVSSFVGTTPGWFAASNTPPAPGRRSRPTTRRRAAGWW